jgi:hypothetical protein
MINKENKVEVSDGRKTRWINADEVAEFNARGFAVVGAEAPVTAVLKPRKIAVEETIAPTESNTPTLEE